MRTMNPVEPIANPKFPVIWKPHFPITKHPVSQLTDILWGPTQLMQQLAAQFPSVEDIEAEFA